jgi:hypothetical protein
MTGLAASFAVGRHFKCRWRRKRRKLPQAAAAGRERLSLAASEAVRHYLTDANGREAGSGTRCSQPDPELRAFSFDPQMQWSWLTQFDDATKVLNLPRHLY